jgi:hypothetical protein
VAIGALALALSQFVPVADALAVGLGALIFAKPPMMMLSVGTGAKMLAAFSPVLSCMVARKAPMGAVTLAAAPKYMSTVAVGA